MIFGKLSVLKVRLQKIDDTNRGDHSYLRSDDQCFFLYEYTRGVGYSHSATNQLILNLKKKRNDPGYHYKLKDIEKCANDLSQAISPKWLETAILVPVPPSKIKTDNDYDDRMLQICRKIRSDVTVNVREMIEQTVSTEAVHHGQRIRPEKLMQMYRFNEPECKDIPMKIGIVDDVLTAGAHFRAMKNFILKHFPNRQVVGFFIARRAIAGPLEVGER